MSVYRYIESETVYAKQLSIATKDYHVYVDKLDSWIRVQLIGTGKPLLFVHGSLSSGAIFYPLVPHLKEYSCVVLDRFGCGLSTGEENIGFSKKKFQEAHSAVIASICDFFNYDKIHVVASSFGGYLTLLSLLRYSPRIDKVVLMGCPAIIQGMEVPLFMKVLSSKLGRWLSPKLPNNRFAIKNILKQLGHSHSLKNRSLSIAFMDWYASLFKNTPTQRNELSLLGKLLQGGKMNPQFTINVDEIGSIKKPVLLLWGDEDPFGNIEMAYFIVDKLNNANLLLLKHSGHLPWMDQPSFVASEIKNFIEK